MSILYVSASHPSNYGTHRSSIFPKLHLYAKGQSLLAELRKNREASNALKREIAEALASQLTQDGLDDRAMLPYREAVTKAAFASLAAPC